MRGGEAKTGKRSRRERGQALVEFAFVVPIFLVLLLGIVDFGWALRSWITVTNSAREAARLGAVGATCDDIKQRAVDTAAGLLTLNDVDTPVNCQGDPGTDVSVTVRYDYSWITPVVPMVDTMLSLGGILPDPLPSTLTMVSESHMRIE